MRVPTLKTMEGETVVARIPTLSKDLVLVRLHRVETHGLWIECQTYTDALMKRFGMSSSTTTPLLFFPFASIGFVMSSVRMLSLSEEAYGLGNS